MILSDSIKVLYIPESLNVVKDNLRIISSMQYMEDRFTVDDCLTLYVENERFLRGDTQLLFTDFTAFFKDDEWVTQHSDEINKELKKLEFKRSNQFITTDDYLKCEVYFNGVTVFLVQTDTVQHHTLNDFMDCVLTKLSHRLDIFNLMQTDLFKRFSLPFVLKSEAEQNKVV